MQEVARVDAANGSPRWLVGRRATGRRSALVACALVALLIHAVLIGGVSGFDFGTPEERTAIPVSVRTIVPEPPIPSPDKGGADIVAFAQPVPPAPIVIPKASPRPTRAISPPAEIETREEKAGARIEDAASAPAEEVQTSMTELPTAADAGVASASSPGAQSDSAPLLAAGEEPPPVYRTRLPPPATLHYLVRRGIWQGAGEIRWHPAGETYQLSLEARIAGLTLLVQTSAGAIDANGLAPVRFLDQRARRPAQAANFRRDIERISFSGPAVEWPLLPGSQDRLSWMIQLAAIAAAEPALLVEGAKISMVVVGARGEAAVWTLRSAGYEEVQTARGTVHAVKLVREARSISDTGAEIWLDPARDYFPAHATMRNREGGAEYELLLERVEPS